MQKSKQFKFLWIMNSYKKFTSKNNLNKFAQISKISLKKTH